jgi:hypothetical protein
VADQTLVADVEDVVGPDFPRPGRREEAKLGTAEDVDHGQHRRGIHPGDAGDLLQARRQSDVATGCRPRAQAAKQDLGDPPLFIVERRVGRVRLAREGPLHAAEGLVCGQRQDAGLVRALPEPHEGVLHQGELVRVGAHIVQDARDERRLDLAVEHLGRTLDRLPPLGTGELRGQELAVVECFGKSVEERAVAEVVGPHRQDDVDGLAGFAPAGQQQGDERTGLVALAFPLAPVAEEFLELVDEQKELAASGQRGFVEYFGQPERTAQEHGVELAGGVVEVRPGRTEHCGVEQRFGEPPERTVTGPHRGDGPPRTGGPQEPGPQRRDQAGMDQRRLAATRRPHHGYEALAPEPLEQLVDLLVATEVDHGLVGPERA